MEQCTFLLHALSPLHAGTGHSADVIDLPIARMKATGIPFLPGSSIKGVMRDGSPRNDEKTWAVFGPETENAGDHAGALTISDARLLVMPVRSFKGTFAWVSCPLLLTLAQRDGLKVDPQFRALEPASAFVTDTTICMHDGKLYLEDLDLEAETNGEVTDLAAELAKRIFPESPDVFKSRFVVVDDETMTFLWETATQLDTRIRIDTDTKTVADGALWVEESLPPETLLIGITEADKSRRTKDRNGNNLTPMSPADVLKHAFPTESRVLQFGGKATVGRGRCRIILMSKPAGGANA